MDTGSSSVLQDQTCQRFTLSEIQSATNNFDEILVIGRGGFGKVYKCATMNIGSVSEVAVKRLHSNSSQGAVEFEAEVKVLSKLRHGNLVSLIGYCNEGNEMALVYEFIPNGTLEDNLHNPDSCLLWLQLLKVCVGAARGLDYLHTGTSTQHGIIHRDVKSSNILLDANFDAKISDFGLAKIGLISQTHVSTGVKGTFGYMDPCYFYTGKLSTKSDVYAFGVVLFEVLSGKKAVDPTLEDKWGLAGWAQYQIKKGKLNQIIDSRLIGQISKKCLKEFASIAGHCLHTEPTQRPTMAEVVFKLESILSEVRKGCVIDERDLYKLQSLFNRTVNATIGSDSNHGFRAFTYAELVLATNDFKDKEYSPTLDESIYKGWVDERTYAPAKYGVGLAMYVRRIYIQQWKPDIKLVEEFNNTNLVKLLGYCLHWRFLYCVYEFSIPNITSLDKLLYGAQTNSISHFMNSCWLTVGSDIRSLSWIARLQILWGVANGLFYLQRRNLPAYSQFKTDLILVDRDCNPRLSDFAFDSYTFRRDPHYAAPELFDINSDGYWLLDGLSPLSRDDAIKSEILCYAMKNDIYAFGVVMLEILTGMKVYDDKRPSGKHNLVEWAIPLLPHKGNLAMIVDPKLQPHDWTPKGAFLLAQLISICLQPKQDKRPSMEKILEILRDCCQQEVLQLLGVSI